MCAVAASACVQDLESVGELESTSALTDEGAAAGSPGIDRAPAEPGLGPSDDSPSGEAALAITASQWGLACRIACWTAAGMGCAAVSTSCTGSTVITLGGTTIPCTWAVIAACGVVSGGAQYCAERLCPP